MKKSDLIIALCCYIMLCICDIALTAICFMTVWPIGIFTILFGGFIVVLIISTIQQMCGKKPIIKQEKENSKPYQFPAKKNGVNSFWKAVGILTVIDEISELNETPPIKKKSILNSTYYDNEHLHTEEGHETEDGYCMECDIAVEDILE